MKKKRIIESVKINNYLELIFDTNNVYLQVGGMNMGACMRININDFWIQIREFYEERYLKEVGEKSNLA
jgi:hypothetical protein